jgi:hypothetical protein
MFNLNKKFNTDFYRKKAKDEEILKDLAELDAECNECVVLGYDDDGKIYYILKGYTAYRRLANALKSKYIYKSQVFRSVRRSPLYECGGDVITVYYDGGGKDEIFVV